MEAPTTERQSDVENVSRPPVEAISTEQRVEPPDQKEQLDKDKKEKSDDKPNAGNPPSPPPPPPPGKPRHRWRKWLIIIGVIAAIGVGLYFFIPWLISSLTTVTTDDAYIHGHVTMVAPRVGGQVKSVLVDDNMRVKTGDVLVELDKEPYRVQVAIKQAAVAAAETDLNAARAQVRGLMALARSQRWQLQTAIDQVAAQVANLNAAYATYKSKEANLQLAVGNLKRGEDLRSSGAISKEELQSRQQTVKAQEADARQSLEAVQAVRVALGLAAATGQGQELVAVPSDLEQTYPGVRTALANLVQTMAQIGLPLPSASAAPRQVLEEFRKRDSGGNIDRIVEQLIPNSPQVQQAEAKLLQSRRDLDQAVLNLRYCDIVSEIDGVVTRRNVNPGNNVQIGQSLMAVRSLTEIWIDANFKETQLGYLRIGQRVRCEVDMYGSKREFEGRITGFTMGTGQTLSLLPPENATGNFVKIVQRLPVRIELIDYNPDKTPLFAGLSVVPYVYYKESPTGLNAGNVLQPPAALPKGTAYPTP